MHSCLNMRMCYVAEASPCFLCEPICENQAVMSYVWVSRRTWLCLELHGGCKRSVFGLLVAWVVQHRDLSVAWRTRGVPGARGVNKYAVKSVLREVWKKSEGETLGFVWNSSLPLTYAVHMLSLSSTLSHTHTHLQFSFHTHLTWRFTVQINSSSSSGPVLA